VSLSPYKLARVMLLLGTGNLDVNWRVILKCILKKWARRTCTLFASGCGQVAALTSAVVNLRVA
jgi:hypothetical protein